jgi:predicted Zn-dependent protease
MKYPRQILLTLLFTLIGAAAFFWSGLPGVASRPAARPAQSQAGGVYPQFRSQFGVIRWLSDQMPLKVYIAPGLSLDSIIDPELGAPFTSVDNRDRWPDLVADVISNPDKLKSLEVAEGYQPAHYQAAIQGISSWHAFEKEGLFSFQIVNDPADADIYVFWTKHFVNKMGLALFENDIRGYTAKRSFPYAAILAGKQAQFRPVVTLLRTTDSNGNSMPPLKMQASAAHEFGHALGIEGHSVNVNDLMSVYYGHGAISTNDAATIRYLYHLKPDLIP